jgi:hypothetical protein
MRAGHAYWSGAAVGEPENDGEPGMNDEHKMVLRDPNGKQHILPIDPQRLKGVRFLGRKGFETPDL